ncbi:MAG: hypothetical protein AABZ47_11430 [Planctomycetota bacterium]
MPTAQQLDIKVIYTASDRPRPRRVRSPKTPSRRVAVTRGKGGFIVGLLNVALAGCFSWAIWYQVDPFLYMTMMWKTPLPPEAIQSFATNFGIGLPGDPLSPMSASTSTRPARFVGPPDPPIPPPPSAVTPQYSGNTARTVIGATMYGWLTVATLSAGFVALAGGVALSSKLGGGAKTLRRRLFLLGLIGLLGFAAFIAYQHGKNYPPDQLRAWMCGFVLVFALAGFAKDRGTRSWCRIAGLGLIFAAMCSAAGLYLFGQCDAIESNYTTVAFMAGVLVIHSFYGWLLFPLGSWANR